MCSTQLTAEVMPARAGTTMDAAAACAAGPDAVAAAYDAGPAGLDLWRVLQQKQRRFFLEVFRTAAVAKMRRPWQKWHRPQTLRVYV